MDWQFAIDKNREALAIVVAGLIAMARQPGSRPHHRAILRILRPAEAALRRLIVVVAAMLVRKAREGRGADRAVENSTPLPDFFAFNRRDHMPSFPLIDPRKRFGQVARANGLGTPRISLPGVFDVANPAKPDKSPDTAALLRRIRRLQFALGTLPRQARRLNRLMAKRAKAPPGSGRIGPIRPGHPPGHRRKPVEPVDDILRNCHWLARETGFKPP